MDLKNGPWLKDDNYLSEFCDFRGSCAENLKEALAEPVNKIYSLL
jgi:hypothetical protein